MLFSRIAHFLGKGRSALANRRLALPRAWLNVAGKLTYTDVLVVLRFDPRVGPDIQAGAPAPDGCEMRFLSDAEIAAAAGDEETELHLPYVREALERGDRCFGVFDTDGTLLSYSWYSTTATGVTQELTFEFPASHIYMHHAFTHPRARGRRLHGVSIRAAFAQLNRPRLGGMLAIVSAANMASLKSCKRGGFSPLGQFYLVGGLNRLMAITGRRCRRFGCNVAPRRDDFGFIAVA